MHDGQRPPLQSKQVRLSSWRKLVMRIRPLCFVLDCGAHAAGVHFSAPRRKESVWRAAKHHRPAACAPQKRVIATLIALMPIVCSAADTTSISANGDQLPEAAPVVVSATRFEIPLD